MTHFVSRAGLKLEHALAHFGLDVAGLVCADFGCNVGGFTDCLLRRGAVKVYAIDTGYGALDYRLRTDHRVVPMERTNAMHVALPERVDLVTIDVAWTRQAKILPSAHRVLRAGGEVVSLIKPHYESAPTSPRAGVLPEAEVGPVVTAVLKQARAAGFEPVGTVGSPIKGSKGNVEILCRLKRL